MAKAVATKKSTAVATTGGAIDFAAHAGRGMEGATQDSFAIPFIKTLQKMSPQVDEDSGAAIKGAKAGMFFETVSKTMYDGKKGILIVPCAYRRTFLRWGPRGTDSGGFKGEIAPEELTKMRADGIVKELEGRLFFPLADGSINPKKCDSVDDVRNHYVLLVDEDEGVFTQALMSLTSTQIKKSKNLMSALANKKLTAKDGSRYTPPTFANLVRVTSVPESNDNGSWHGVNFALEGEVADANIFQAALDYNQTIAKGQINVDYNQADDSSSAGGGKGF